MRVRHKNITNVTKKTDHFARYSQILEIMGAEPARRWTAKDLIAVAMTLPAYARTHRILTDMVAEGLIATTTRMVPSVKKLGMTSQTSLTLSRVYWLAGTDNDPDPEPVLAKKKCDHCGKSYPDTPDNFYEPGSHHSIAGWCVKCCRNRAKQISMMRQDLPTNVPLFDGNGHLVPLTADTSQVLVDAFCHKRWNVLLPGQFPVDYNGDDEDVA